MRISHSPLPLLILFLLPSPTTSNPPPSTPIPTAKCIPHGLSLTNPLAAAALLPSLRNTKRLAYSCTIPALRSNGMDQLLDTKGKVHGPGRKELKGAREEIAWGEHSLGQGKIYGTVGAKATLVVGEEWDGRGVGVDCDRAAEYVQMILDKCTGKKTKKVAGRIPIKREDIFCRDVGRQGEEHEKEWKKTDCEIDLVLEVIA